MSRGPRRRELCNAFIASLTAPSTVPSASPPIRWYSARGACVEDPGRVRASSRRRRDDEVAARGRLPGGRAARSARPGSRRAGKRRRHRGQPRTAPRAPRPPRPDHRTAAGAEPPAWSSNARRIAASVACWRHAISGSLGTLMTSSSSTQTMSRGSSWAIERRTVDLPAPLAPVTSKNIAAADRTKWDWRCCSRRARAPTVRLDAGEQLYA